VRDRLVTDSNFDLMRRYQDGETHYDRTFRYTEGWKERDRQFVLDAMADGANIGEAVTAWLVKNVFGKPIPRVPREKTGQMNRSLWVTHCWFVEYMKQQENPHHYLDLVPEFDRYFKVMGAIGAGAPGSDNTREDINTTVQMHYQQAGFLIAGKKVYEVSLGLALELLDTELRGILTDELRLPFETIYINVPRRARLRVPNVQTGTHYLEGIYITEDTDTNGDRMWRFLLCGEPKPIIVDGAEWDNDALLHWKMTLPEGITLDEAVERCEREMREQTDSEAFKTFIPDFRETFRFAMNAILYATMPDADVEELIHDPEARKLFARIKKLPKGKKRRKLSDRLKELNTDKRTVLGRTVVIDRTALAAREDDTEVGTHSRKLHVQYRRKGHWRWQRYGSMSVPLEDRPKKRIYIQPTWVGPKGAPISMTTYKLELPDEETVG
jgi:hypothetical protein